MNQINQQNEILQKQELKLKLLDKEKNHLQFLIQKEQNQLNNLYLIKEKNNEELSKQEENLKQYYHQKEQQINQKYQNYKNNLQLKYQQEEEKTDIKIKQLNSKKESIKNQIQQIQKIYQAAVAAKLRDQEEQNKQSFYCIQITDKQVADIVKLQQWKYNLYDPTIVAKIIWSSYILKPTSALCNRVIGSSQTSGIYKITNRTTGEIYIGQSVNIADRFKQHIKCGLGIDASPTNKLYNNMQEWGIWNFKFEVLQKCSRSQLNEKEKFWINMYQSNKIGLNIQRGANK